MRLNNRLPVSVRIGALLMTSCTVLDEMARSAGTSDESAGERVA